MRIRCGGNVIEIGRRQIAVVTAAAVILFMVSTYSLSILHSMRQTDADWIQPTPIDHLLQRAARDHRPDSVEQAGKGHAPRRIMEEIRRRTHNTGGMGVQF